MGKKAVVTPVKNKSVTASPAKKSKLKHQEKASQQKKKKQEEEYKEEVEEQEEMPQKTEQQEASLAANEVSRKKGLIQRLVAAREAVAEKLKDKMKEYNKQIKA